MANKHIVILGGYGNFGKRIAESLLDLPNTTLLICGRDQKKADRLCDQLKTQSPASELQAVQIDFHASHFETALKALNPFIVIHTGGPFQGQDYRVPQACINIGAHYIDLADDRRFVCDITQLDEDAKRKNVLVISGASSVPGLSSAVVDHYLPQFQTLADIDFAISPGNQAERGEATIRAILSYTGHPFKVFRNRKWVDVFGWGESKQRNFGGAMGNRWLANIDIPDLELFPKRYPSVDTVHFQAGLELPILHHGMSFMSKLTQKNIITDWSRFTKRIVATSEWFKRFGTDNGGMQVTLKGTNHSGQALHINWTLYANDGVGPYIPTLSTIILVRKIILGSLSLTGAQPCLGLVHLDEFDQYIDQWGIYHTAAIHVSE